MGRRDHASVDGNGPAADRRNDALLQRAQVLNNDLAEAHFKLNGRRIALQDIRLPVFVVGAERDHVSPWRSVFKRKRRRSVHFLRSFRGCGPHKSDAIVTNGTFSDWR